MINVQQNMTRRALEGVKDQPVPDDDIEILVRAGIKLLSQGGIKVIADALNSSKDPAQVIGQFMAQLIIKMGEDMVERLRIDPRAFLAKGGFLEELLDYIEEQLGLAPEFSDQIYSETAEVVKAALMQSEQPSKQPLDEAAGGM
jgi:hypothetical protein